MADKASTGAISTILSQYNDLNSKTKTLVSSINSNFNGIKLNTTPFDNFSKGISKAKAIMDVLNFPKMALGVVQSTTAIAANTLATGGNTAAKNAGIIATAKDISENVQLTAMYAKEKAASMAEKAASMAESAQIVGMYAKEKAALVAHTIAEKAATVAKNANAIATKALNLVEKSSPILLIIGLIALLVVAIVTLWNKNEAFRKVIMTGWNAIKTFFSALWNGISTGISVAWKAISTIFTNAFNAIKSTVVTIFGNVSSFIGNTINNIKNVFSSVFNGIRSVVSNVFGDISKYISNSINNIKQIFGGIIEFIQGVFTGNWQKAFQGLKDIVGGIFGEIVNVVKLPINLMIDLINGLIGGINGIIGKAASIPGIGGALRGVHIPTIPKLARGGIIDGPTFAMLGEAGREAVVPLENTGFVSAIAAAVGTAVSSAVHGNSGTSSSGDVNVTLQIDKDILGKATVSAINDRIRTTGVIPLTI